MSRIRADKFVNNGANGAPQLTFGAEVVAGVGLTGAGGINITGIATATSFSGNVTGNISGGTVAGSTGTFTGDVDIADKIVHTSDTNTAIRFPAADTFSVETGGSEALRVDSSQRLLIGETSVVLDSSNALLQMGASEGANMVLYRDDSTVTTDDSLGLIRFYSNAGSSKQEHARITGAAGAASGADDKPGNLIFYTTADGASSPTERLRITSEGKLFIDRTHASATTGDHPALDIDTYANGTAGATFATGIDFRIAGVHKKRLAVTNADANPGTGDWVFYRDNGVNEALRITSAGLSEFTASSTVATFTGNGIEVNNSLGSNVFIGTQSGSDGKLGTKNNSQMSLFTNSDFAKRASLGTNGDFTLNDGDFVVQSGHGINFSATSDGGGMTSELLDDYEEGTWTPVCTSSGYTLISASTKGFYTKIGNLVSIHFQVKFSSVGTNLASASFSGVPFASSSELHHAGVTRESTSYGDIFVAQVVAGNANVAINSMDGVVNGDNASFAINRNYNTQLTYFV